MKLTQFNGAGGKWGTHLKDYQVTPMSSRALLDYEKIREAKVHLDVSLYYFFTREESSFQMTLDQVKVKTFSKSKQISSAFENDCHHFKLDSHAQRDYYQLLRSKCPTVKPRFKRNPNFAWIKEDILRVKHIIFSYLISKYSTQQRLAH